MTTHRSFKPANELAKKNGVRFPNESGDYRSARDLLLAEEIELRRRIEPVAVQRRALPAGGTVPKNCVFIIYEGRGPRGHRFRNTEIVTVRRTQIVEVEISLRLGPVVQGAGRRLREEAIAGTTR